jgi:hypothetical protein
VQYASFGGLAAPAPMTAGAGAVKRIEKIEF